ncbi:hypothetical protein C1H46_045426 [Malus baccata]|uniref:Uncharacterized protein n=1 Tax=Malus baccata TaxID=106549 RepID=A0A540K483_MALBA|nr:hypothetical protein C1H46_045426 [Malus baccata]
MPNLEADLPILRKPNSSLTQTNIPDPQQTNCITMSAGTRKGTRIPKSKFNKSTSPIQRGRVNSNLPTAQRCQLTDITENY